MWIVSAAFQIGQSGFPLQQAEHRESRLGLFGKRPELPFKDLMSNKWKSSDQEFEDAGNVLQAWSIGVGLTRAEYHCASPLCVTRRLIKMLRPGAATDAPLRQWSMTPPPDSFDRGENAE